MNLALKINRKEIEEFCEKWRVAELAVFGSALRDDFRPDSDVDILVRFFPRARTSLFDLQHMEEELKGIFGQDVDLVERSVVERSRNYLRRRAILGDLEQIYASR